MLTAIGRASLRIKACLLVALEFHYIEVVFTADARGKIHRQFLAALPDLDVVG
jgi:hypothetical protein